VPFEKAKRSGSVAEESTSKRTKRRLRAPSETVRERQSSAQTRAAKPAGPVRRFFRLLGRPFVAFAHLSIWQSKGWKPFKFVGHWVGLLFWPPYFRRSFGELRMVTWTNWRQTWRLTFAVLGFAAVFGLVIAGVDYGLDKLFKEVLLK
jgi:preprotein translocase SecE subunit